MSSIMSLNTKYYDLFSRGAKDWLRHNVKIQESLKKNLPDLLANQDVITNPNNRTIKLPVKFLEHSRFRLNSPQEAGGVGQGEGDVGTVLRPGQQEGDQPSDGPGGNNGGEIQFVIELSLDQVIDYLWEELKLPDLKPKRSVTLNDPDYIKEGWDKRGARSRLDRRKTLKEAVKRRAMQEDPIPFTNEDLRFRQLVKRDKPSTNAVVFFALDVSGSMDESQRKLAKTFFFFALQGIRRQYSKVDVRFLAHAGEAWEFNENEFFQASSSGGTVTSTVLKLTLDIIEKSYDPSAHNIYFFYASDGDNSPDDLQPSVELLTKLAKMVNYAGYVETDAGPLSMAGAVLKNSGSQLSRLFGGLKGNNQPVGMSRLATNNDIWAAIREFFKEDTRERQ